MQRNSRLARPAVGGVRLAAALCAVALSACTTIGAGSGHVARSGAPVEFSWTSRSGGQDGEMTASLSDGRTFRGPFLQVRSTQTVELDPLWNGWRPYWRDWSYWGPMDATAFATRYSGKVVANLSDETGARMRCRFHLNEPVSGMSGGGQGECQFANGQVIDAVFGKGRTGS